MRTLQASKRDSEGMADGIFLIKVLWKNLAAYDWMTSKATTQIKLPTNAKFGGMPNLGLQALCFENLFEIIAYFKPWKTAVWTPRLLPNWLSAF